jgi:hypothetical protein
MIRKFELCSLRLVGFGDAKAETNGGQVSDIESDGDKLS